MLMDYAMLSHAKLPVAHCTHMKSPDSKRCERYLKHIAASHKIVTCRLLAHTYMVRPNSTWSIRCGRIIKASLQQIQKKSN